MKKGNDGMQTKEGIGKAPAKMPNPAGSNNLTPPQGKKGKTQKPPKPPMKMGNDGKTDWGNASRM